MLKAIAIALSLIAMTSVVEYTFELQAVEAQRRGGGRGGRGGGGGGNWGGNGGGGGAQKDPRTAGRNRGGRGEWGKGGDWEKRRSEWDKKREEWRKKGGTGGKRDGVDLNTIPEWWMQRASTWMTAAEQDMPMLLGFVSQEDALEAKYWVDQEIADLSRKDVIFVMCIEGHTQVGMDKPKEEGSVADAPMGGESDDSEAAKDEDKDGSEDSEDADGDDEAKKEEGESDEDKKDGPDFFGAGDIERDWSDDEKELHAECIASEYVPASNLWFADLRESYEVKRNNTFVLVDPWGRELKKFTSKPSLARVEREIESWQEDREEVETELQEHLDEAVKAEEEGKRDDQIDAMMEIFEAELPGHPTTMAAADMYFDLLDDAYDELMEARERDDKDAIRALERAFKDTDLESEFEEEEDE